LTRRERARTRVSEQNKISAHILKSPFASSLLLKPLLRLHFFSLGNNNNNNNNNKKSLPLENTTSRAEKKTPPAARARERNALGSGEAFCSRARFPEKEKRARKRREKERIHF
jgi:hypothetical protein